MNNTMSEELPSLSKLEAAGYRTMSPDLVYIENFRAYVSIKNAVANRLILVPEPKTANPPKTGLEELQAKTTHLQPNNFKTKLLTLFKK